MIRLILRAMACACMLIMMMPFPRAAAQRRVWLAGEADLQYLKELTRVVMDSSRIFPGQRISRSFGPNGTGGVLIRPGGRDAYPAFWIRDYAMSLETGFVTRKEQQHMLVLTAATQCDQTWITTKGSMVPSGAIADHIRIDDGLPIYYPGTYDYAAQGSVEFGMEPPYCDQFFFIHMASYYVVSTGDLPMLRRKINGTPLIDRMERAFAVPPSRPESGLVYTNEAFRGVDFGFRDAEEITGDLCMASVLKYQAALELAGCFDRLGESAKARSYGVLAKKIKEAIPSVFRDAQGLLRASTGRSGQPDVWATALAVYLDILRGEILEKACQRLADAYQKGTLAYKGNIRHVLTTDDYDEKTMWEHSLVEKGVYQNGAYWGTPTGWVCYAISLTDSALARNLAREYIADLREHDFRKGAREGAPFECFGPRGYTQNPLYLATVACPYIAFSKK